MEELKAYLYVGRPIRLSSARTVKFVLMPVLVIALCVAASYFIYTTDPELGRMILPVMVVWAVLACGTALPMLLLSHMTIIDGTLCARICGVINRKYSKDEITRVWRKKDQIIIGLRGNRRQSMLDTPEARKILERLQIPVQ